MDEKRLFKYLRTEDIKHTQSGRMFDNLNPPERFMIDAIPAVKAFTENPLPFTSPLPYTPENIADTLKILHKIAFELQQSQDFKKMVEIYKARFPDRKDIERQVIQSYLFKSYTLHPSIQVKQNDRTTAEIAYLFREVINKGFADNKIPDVSKIMSKVNEKIINDLKIKLIQNFFSVLNPEPSDLINAINNSCGTEKYGDSASPFQRIGSGAGINVLMDHLSSLPKKTQLNFLKACKGIDPVLLSEDAQTVLGALQTHLEILNPPTIFEKAKNFLSSSTKEKSPKELKEKHSKKASVKTQTKNYNEMFESLSLQWEKLKYIDMASPLNVDKLTHLSHDLNNLLDDKDTPKSVSFEADKLLQALINKLQLSQSTQQSENTTSPRAINSASSPRADATASRSELMLEASGAESSDEAANPPSLKHSH
jgi:hypothetical protein